MRRLVYLIVAAAAVVMIAAWGVSIGRIDPAHAPALSRDDVRQARHRRQAHGLYDGKLDGVLGPATKDALRRFQRTSGLAETAELDPPTQERLAGAPTDSGASGVPRAGTGADRAPRSR